MCARWYIQTTLAHTALMCLFLSFCLCLFLSLIPGYNKVILGRKRDIRCPTHNSIWLGYTRVIPCNHTHLLYLYVRDVYMYKVGLYILDWAESEMTACWANTSNIYRLQLLYTEMEMKRARWREQETLNKVICSPLPTMKKKKRSSLYSWYNDIYK